MTIDAVKILASSLTPKTIKTNIKPKAIMLNVIFVVLDPHCMNYKTTQYKLKPKMDNVRRTSRIDPQFPSSESCNFTI